MHRAKRWAQFSWEAIKNVCVINRRIDSEIWTEKLCKIYGKAIEAVGK